MKNQRNLIAGFGQHEDATEGVPLSFDACRRLPLVAQFVGATQTSQETLVVDIPCGASDLAAARSSVLGRCALIPFKHIRTVFCWCCLLVAAAVFSAVVFFAVAAFYAAAEFSGAAVFSAAAFSVGRP